MPIMYVNPAPKKRGTRRVRPLRGATLGKKRTSRRRRKNGRKVAVAQRKGKSMARKLYGAAAKAHAKRLAKTRRKRRKNPARRKRHARRAVRRRRRNPAVMAAPTTNPRRRRRRRRNPAASAAYRAGYEATFKPKRKRKAKSASPKRRRKARTVAQRRAAARRRYHAKHPSAKRRPGTRALRRARRSIKRAYRYGGRAAAYARRHKMRSNPRRRRSRRRGRRNPSLSGLTGTLMGALKVGAPLAASFYLTKMLINKVGPSIPGLNSLPMQMQAPALATGMVFLANFATRKGPLAKYRMGIMAGVSLNLVDTLVRSFAPDSVKAMFGLGDSGMYDQAMGEFVTVGDYLQVGTTPIDDDIALSDYVEMSGVEEELGALQEELGVEEELGNGSPFGDSGPNRLGGVGQSTMMKALKASSAVGVVPQRSFIKNVPHAGAGYDNPSALYTGIFGGGF